MGYSKLFKSRYSVLWLLIPLIALVSIQFLGVAQGNIIEIDDEVKGQNVEKNEDDYREIISETNLNALYLFSTSGISSYYAHKFHKRRTSSGERFDMFENTAAHRKLPFGTILKVTNLANGKSTLVRINDRGPHIQRRLLDLSYASAKEIEGLGLAKVKIEGFLRGKHNIAGKMNKKYYYAYSLFNEPACIPIEIVSKIDSSDNFQEIYEKLKSISNFPYNQNVYLVVDADKNPADAENKYYLARVGTIKQDKNLSRL